MTFQNIQIENFDNLEIFGVTDSRQEFPPHYHETFCISIIEKGAFIENNSIATQNSLLISNPMEVHTNSVLPDVDYSLKTFYVNKEVFRFAAGTKEDFLLERIITDQDLFRQMKALSHQIPRPSEKMQLTKGFENDFISLLSQLSHFKITEADQVNDEPDWIPEVKSHIIADLGVKISLDTLAAIAGLDKYQFIRVFKRTTGLTPFQYIMLVRVMVAKKMLLQGKPLTSTALDAGFYDQSNFTNYFRLYVGVTPRAYQKSCNIFQER